VASIGSGASDFVPAENRYSLGCVLKQVARQPCAGGWCRAGHVPQRLRGARPTGIDLSTMSISRHFSSARGNGSGGIELIRASAEQLSFDPQSVDVVICTEVLEHTQHLDVVIRELTRVATPDARFVGSIPKEAKRRSRQALHHHCSSLAAVASLAGGPRQRAGPAPLNVPFCCASPTARRALIDCRESQPAAAGALGGPCCMN
jgi:SAM-dependent methyltransferase